MAEKLKIISLGGLNEIGKNLTVYEYGGGFSSPTDTRTISARCPMSSAP